MTGNAENTAVKQRGRPFQKGQSGNPAGKPKGARHRSTLLAEQLMETDAEEVVHAVLDAAKGGDMTAARLVLERISPVRKGRKISVDLPPLVTVSDVAAALGTVIASVAAGDLTPEEGAAMANLVELKGRSIEATEIENRLSSLERRAEIRR